MKTIMFLIALLEAGIANAQDFRLVSFTVDGGGAALTGGDFSLVGTSGQPDGCPTLTGAFTFEGGFWPDVSVSAPPQPYLQIATAPNGRVVLSWPIEFQNWLLEASASLSGATWTVIGGGQPDGAWMSLILPADGSARFFRLAQP